GVRGIISATLDEAKRGVAEWGRDHEGAKGTRSLFVCFDIVDRSAAPSFQQAERSLDVRHSENDATHSVGVLVQIARRAPTGTERRGANHSTSTGLEHQRPLLPAFGQPRPTLRDLAKIQPFGVEPATALEISHVVVNGFDTQKT